MVVGKFVFFIVVYCRLSLRESALVKRTFAEQKATLILASKNRQNVRQRKRCKQPLINKLLDRFDANVLKLGPHRLSRVELQGHNAFFQSKRRFVVGEIKNQLIVQVMLDVGALADNHDVIPLIEFH